MSNKCKYVTIAGTFIAIEKIEYITDIIVNSNKGYSFDINFTKNCLTVSNLSIRELRDTRKHLIDYIEEVNG